VLPNNPATLCVYVHFLCEQGDISDLDVLCAVATEAGLEVDRSCLNGDIVWIEVLTQRVPALSPEHGTVVPFMRPPRERAAVAR
jgi:hypothetical protein